MKNELEMKETLDMLGSRIGLKSDSPLYPMIATSDAVFSDGISVYKKNGTYYYVAMERGKVVEKKQSEELEGIMYYVFAGITSHMASRFSAKNREEGKDFRRLYFSHQLKLLEKVDKKYAEKMSEEIREILIKAPFVDR